MSTSAPNLDALQGYLKVVTDRQQMIVSNMANSDTPGYHTKDIDFQSAMRHVMSGDTSMQLEPASMELNGLPERPDGNNVNIDRESLLLSQTQLQFQLGIQLVKNQFSHLLIAIKEGA
jgi:flagellar basal-body rod protein FlgB